MQWRGGGVNEVPGIARRELEQVSRKEQRMMQKDGKTLQRAVADICTSPLWENEWFGILKEPTPELGDTGC